MYHVTYFMLRGKVVSHGLNPFAASDLEEAHERFQREAQAKAAAEQAEQRRIREKERERNKRTE
jgi:response regulator of citrate/malate metabolism